MCTCFSETESAKEIKKWINESMFFVSKKTQNDISYNNAQQINYKNVNEDVKCVSKFRCYSSTPDSELMSALREKKEVSFTSANWKVAYDKSIMNKKNNRNVLKLDNKKIKNNENEKKNVNVRNVGFNNPLKSTAFNYVPTSPAIYVRTPPPKKIEVQREEKPKEQNTTAKPTGNGLFGGSNKSTTSLFGGGNASNNSTSSGFGGTGNSNKPTTGLFGGGNASTQSSGSQNLFGKSSGFSFNLNTKS